MVYRYRFAERLERDVRTDFVNVRTDGQSDTTKLYSPQTIRNAWELKNSCRQLSAPSVSS